MALTVARAPDDERAAGDRFVHDVLRGRDGRGRSRARGARRLVREAQRVRDGCRLCGLGLWVLWTRVLPAMRGCRTSGTASPPIAASSPSAEIDRLGHATLHCTSAQMRGVRFPLVDVPPGGASWSSMKPMSGQASSGLDHETCYRAVSSRDARFDGVFYTAVRTTGIYCRPSCPAVTPKRANVEFFPTAAAAHDHGYRACKRCRPDASPGSPEWDVRKDAVARAMRLVADGVVDREGVGGLAKRLHYSTRHLNRIISSELGAGPLAIARAQRAPDLAHPHRDDRRAVHGDRVRGRVRQRAAVQRHRAGRLRRLAQRPAGEAPATRRRASRPTDPSSSTSPCVEPFDLDGVLAFLAARTIAGRRVRRRRRLPPVARPAARPRRRPRRGRTWSSSRVASTPASSSGSPIGATSRRP